MTTPLIKAEDMHAAKLAEQRFKQFQELTDKVEMLKHIMHEAQKLLKAKGMKIKTKHQKHGMPEVSIVPYDAKKEG